ncbi:MAG: hypothetical protein HY648_09690, partial [Acidobacteria bacterium]|nr:hypothetical protein [Acidobacteriota bacterium]
AMVIRDYLVKKFKMDDTRFKTKGLGKTEQTDAGEVGKVAIFVYPLGTPVPRASYNGQTNPTSSESKSGKGVMTRTLFPETSRGK